MNNSIEQFWNSKNGVQKEESTNAFYEPKQEKLPNLIVGDKPLRAATVVSGPAVLKGSLLKDVEEAIRRMSIEEALDQACSILKQHEEYIVNQYLELNPSDVVLQSTLDVKTSITIYEKINNHLEEGDIYSALQDIVIKNLNGTTLFDGKCINLPHIFRTALSDFMVNAAPYEVFEFVMEVTEDFLTAGIVAELSNKVNGRF